MYEDSFTQHITVRQCECDMDNRMTPSFMLKYAQDIATAHCDSKGLTGKVYQSTHTAFLLAKLQLLADRPIMCDDAITITTHDYAPRRAMYLRSVTFSNAKGEQCAEVQSVWILIDTDTRRILRHAPDEIASAFSCAIEEVPSVNIIKAELAPIGEQTALYSMCDKNIHINNTVYADIICNNLPIELLRAYFVKELTISYHNEIPFGSKFSLQRGNIADNKYYFVGESSEKKYFEANIAF